MAVILQLLILESLPINQHSENNLILCIADTLVSINSSGYIIPSDDHLEI